MTKPIDDFTVRAPAWSFDQTLRAAGYSVLPAIPDDKPEVDTMRVMILHIAAAADAEEELNLWTRPMVGMPNGASLAWWVGWWAIQRPLQLQAAEQGYTIPGTAVIEAVRETSEEAGADPEVSYGYTGTAEQVRVRYDWPGFEPLIFLRAPRMKSETHPGVEASVDLWQQLDPLEDTATPASESYSCDLATFRPGQFHDGAERKPQDEAFRAMEAPFMQALEAPMPSGVNGVMIGASGSAVTWQDPKKEKLEEVGHEEVVSDTTTLADPGSPLCPVCRKPKRGEGRFGRCVDCQRLVEAGNVWQLPQPPEGPEMRELGQDCYWARVKALKEAKQRRVELGMKPAEQMLAASQDAARAEEPARKVVVDEDTSGEEVAGADTVHAFASRETASSPDFPVMVTVRCTVCEDGKGLMPLAAARDEVAHGCKKCGADSTAIEVKSTATGVVLPGDKIGHPPPSDLEKAILAAPKPVAPPVKQPKVDHKPDLAFRAQSGGRCEWNPKTDEPATAKQPHFGCAKQATLIVGAKDAFKVCATCADRPFFARKRNRIEIKGSGR